MRLAVLKREEAVLANIRLGGYPNLPYRSKIAVVISLVRKEKPPLPQNHGW